MWVVGFNYREKGFFPHTGVASISFLMANYITLYATILANQNHSNVGGVSLAKTGLGIRNTT